jgi:glycosyltransferase involved in cell wall biosynthesis
MNSQTLEPLAPVNTGTWPLGEPKIAVTYLMGSLRDAGTERQTRELMRHLDRTRFSVSAIVMEPFGTGNLSEFVERYQVLNVAQRGASKWVRRAPSLMRALAGIRKQLAQWRTDILHAFLPGPSILGALVAKTARVPVMIGSRRSLPDFYRAGRGFFAARADTLAFHLADLTLGNSGAVCEEMVRVGCPSSKCHTIRNGVDTTRFHPGLARIWRNEMGWGADDIVFGMVANYRPCKRHQDFVDAAAILLQHHPGLKFVMVGADAGSRTEIEKRISELQLEESVFMLESDPCPERILAALDIYVCTSDTEGFSNVLLEALACGKPVIATRVGGNSEIIIDGENGFLVPARSPKSVAAVAEILLDQASLRSSMGARGRELAESRFSLQRMIAEHEQLYAELMWKSRSRQR